MPQKFIWCALRKLGVEEWIVQLVQGMYANVQSHVHVDEAMFTKAWYSAHCSLSLCLNPCHIVPLWGPLGGSLRR